MQKYLILFMSLYSFYSHALFDQKKALLEDEKNTISIYKSSVNSVVHISKFERIRRGGFFYAPHTKEIRSGEGTGFIWDNKGHIVTNYHVISGGSKFKVTFHQDKNEYAAELVGAEPSKDIAVLKLVKGPKEIKALPIGTSKNIQVGQKAVAIGNPFGLDSTITQGIISATGRSIEGVGGVKIYDMIQTDSSINPGNSGGPLLNSSGEIVGVNTIIFSNSGSSAGVGFSVPIDSVKIIVPQLIKYGKVKRAGLGIRPASRREIQYYTNTYLEKGLAIGYVFPKGPAQKSGLRGLSEDQNGYYLGDIILEVDNKEVNSYDDIFNILFEYKVGDQVEIKYKRGKKIISTKLKLTEIPNN